MNILVVVAHPDDEVLGAGATIKKLTSNGHEVVVSILCGYAEARSYRPSTESLHDDMYNSIGYLGVNNIITGSFKDGCLNTYSHIELVRFVENSICDSNADVIFTHHPCDLHNDHKIVSQCCQEAARLSMRMTRPINKLQQLLFMEVLSSTDWCFGMNEVFKPNVFVEVGEQGVNSKIAALAEYEGVMRPFPHPRCEEIIKGLAAVRGGQSGCDYAEAFESAFRREII